MYFPVACGKCSVTSVVSDSLQPYGLCSPPGSSVHGSSQARILEWVAKSSRGSSPPVGQTRLHCKLILYLLASYSKPNLPRKRQTTKTLHSKNLMKDTSVPIEQAGEKKAQLLEIDKLHLQDIHEMTTEKQDTSRKIYLTT